MSFLLNADIVKRIAKKSGSEALKSAESYYRFAKYHAGDNFFQLSIDGTGFLYGTFAKTHFRLMEIAVEKENQKKGYGAMMISILFEECVKRNIDTITFRTSSKENAHLWYRRLGAEYVGIKDNDYEMRLKI